MKNNNEFKNGKMICAHVTEKKGKLFGDIVLSVSFIPRLSRVRDSFCVDMRAMSFDTFKRDRLKQSLIIYTHTRELQFYFHK